MIFLLLPHGNKLYVGKTTEAKVGVGYNTKTLILMRTNVKHHITFNEYGNKTNGLSELNLSPVKLSKHTRFLFPI